MEVEARALADRLFGMQDEWEVWEVWGGCVYMHVHGGELRARTRLLFPLGVHASVFRQVFLQFECTSIKECTGWVCTGEHIIYAQISKHLYTCLRHEGEEVCVWECQQAIYAILFTSLHSPGFLCQ